MTAKSRRAIAKYGLDSCRKAWELNRLRGEGAHTIATAHDVPGVGTTQQADSAIDAYDEYLDTLATSET